MILFALITACHDRAHSYLLIEAPMACSDISWQWTLRQTINKADELQTAAAIIPELLMDRIWLYQPTLEWPFTWWLKLHYTLYRFFSTRSVQTTWLSQAEAGWCKDGEVKGINCCDYHRWGHGEGEAWEVGCHRGMQNISRFTAQVCRTFRWNTVLMKQKHVKVIPPFNIVLTPVVVRQVMHFTGWGQTCRTREWLHLCEMLHFVHNGCKAQKYNYKRDSSGD